MRIFEVMSEHVQTVGPGDDAEKAWTIMQTKGVRHLVVTDGTTVVGVLSDSDAGGRAGQPVRAGKTVADLMDHHVVTIGREDTIRKAANLMNGRLIGCLPVIHRGKLVGVVTISDMLKAVGRGIDRPSHESRAATHYRVPHRKTGSTGRW